MRGGASDLPHRDALSSAITEYYARRIFFRNRLTQNTAGCVYLNSNSPPAPRGQQSQRVERVNPVQGPPRGSSPRRSFHVRVLMSPSHGW